MDFAQNQTWQSHTVQAWLTWSIYQWQSAPGTQGWGVPNSSWIFWAKPHPLPHLPADEAALCINSSLTFLFRDFYTWIWYRLPQTTYGCCIFLMSGSPLKARIQLLILLSTKPPHFWAYICSTAFLGCRLEEKWGTKSSQHCAQCVLGVSSLASSTAAHGLLSKAGGQIGGMKKLPTAIPWECPWAIRDNWSEISAQTSETSKVNPSRNCLCRPLHKETSNASQLCSKSQRCPQACFILQLFFNTLRNFSVVSLSSFLHWASRGKLNFLLLRMCRMGGGW